MNSQASGNRKQMVRLWIAAAAILVMIFIFIGVIFFASKKLPMLGKPQPFQPVASTSHLLESYDVIVDGTEPEGVVAAVSAARNGLKTLLIDDKNRSILGGLMTEGWLNTIDMNYDNLKSHLPGEKQVLNKGIFSEWYHMLEGDSFDIHTAANVFLKLVKKESNISLLMHVQQVHPLLQNGSDGNQVLTGLSFVTADGNSHTVHAKAFIDATQDADLAVSAGVPYTTGRADIGDETSRMAVTLVFRIKNVTPAVWEKIKERLNHDNDPSTGANEMSAWGYSKLQQYEPIHKNRIRMRGLNIGRQNDNTALINALQIFEVNPLNPASIAEAKKIAAEELPGIVSFIKKTYPEFETVKLDGTAPELYVRETRHIEGEYRLNILDVCENRDQWNRIAFGSYPVDIQRISPNDWGSVLCNPKQYAVPFTSIVPLKVDQLLVVGRSASYNTLPAGSARTLPVGMAEGQAAGAAAKLALEKGVGFRELSRSHADIAELQNMLNQQGMNLEPFQQPKLAAMSDPTFPGLEEALQIGAAAGGYDNNFHLDAASDAKQFVNLLAKAKKAHDKWFPGNPNAAIQDIQEPWKLPLTLDQAAYTLALSMHIDTIRSQAAAKLQGAGILQASTLKLIADHAHLTAGETYMLLKDVEDGLTAGKK